MSPEIVRATLPALAQFVERDVVRRRPGTIAVSGGSIAKALFPALARTPIDWQLVDVFWVDERAVGAADPESNFGDASKLWLGPAGVPPNRIHRMRGEDADLAAAARAYEDDLVRIAGTPPRLDYILMGVGPDGHIASLFPGHAALEETGRFVIAIEDSPKPPPRRLTLTLPVLAAARRIVVAALGEGKAKVVEDATRPGSPLPLGRLIALAADRIALLLVE